MQFPGSLDHFEVIFSPPNSTPPELRKPTKTGVRLCTVVFFKSQAQWPKDLSKGAGCIGEVHGAGEEEWKVCLHPHKERWKLGWKNLFGLYFPWWVATEEGGGAGKEDNRMLCRLL